MNVCERVRFGCAEGHLEVYLGWPVELQFSLNSLMKDVVKPAAGVLPLWTRAESPRAILNLDLIPHSGAPGQMTLKLLNSVRR